MDIYQFFREISDLIRKNKKIIAVVTSITILIFVLIQGIRIMNSTQENEIEEDSTALTSEPAQFDIFIEHDTEGTYFNSYLIEIFLTQNDLLEDIQNDTGVPIQPVLDEYAEENESIYTEEDPINVERHRSSHVMFVTVDVGNEDENLAVANAYYSYLQNTNDEFFDNKTVYYFEEPSIQLSEEEFLSKQNSGINILNLVIQSVVVIIAGIIIGIIVAIIKAVLDDRIQYGFTYGWNLHENYISFKDDTPIDKILQSLSLITTNDTVVLTQFEINTKITESIISNEKMTVLSTLEEKNEQNTKTVVLFIQRNKTTKKWYRDQRKYLQLLNYESLNIIELK